MSLSKKLRIDTSKPLWLLYAPEEVNDLFDDCLLKTSFSKKDKIRQLVFCAKNKAHLETDFPKLSPFLPDDALIWIAYPKKSGSLASDLHLYHVWDEFMETYNGVSSAAINEDWSGMRFKRKDPNKNDTYIPPAERKTEGIDYIARTVKLPDDALKAMKPYKGLEAFFYSLSFTHKKEYMESIANAKKPETRERRIKGMIEMILKIKEQKESKKT